MFGTRGLQCSKHVTIWVSLLANIFAFFTYLLYSPIIIIIIVIIIIIRSRCTKYFACGEKDVGIKPTLISINHEQKFGVIHRYERNEKTCDNEYLRLLRCYVLYTGHYLPTFRMNVVPLRPWSCSLGRLESVDNRYINNGNMLKI
jgi:hypothetical protein